MMRISVALMASWACWSFGKLAHAATENPRPIHFKKSLYSSRFSWKGASYHFVVGTTERPRSEPGKSRFAAVITRLGETLAVCERQLLGELPFETHAMTLRCEGAMFSPAAATAKFRFAPSLKQPTLTLWTSPRAAGTQLTLTYDEAANGVRVAEATH